MLNLQLTRFQDSDSVRQLHAKYGSLESSFLSMLWQLFLEHRDPGESSRLLPLLQAMFPTDQQDQGEAYLPPWLRDQFPADEVRLTLVAFRSGALFYYIEAAAVRVDARGELREIRRRLQSLGGKLARLKGVAGRETEQQAIAAQMEDLRLKLRHLPHWPKLDHPQLWWHWTMVRAYESLPWIGLRKQVSPRQVARLCQWLSVPEIGLHCTPATIKAARRRFVSRDWLGHQYLTYIATPRGVHAFLTMEPKEGKDAASEQAMESIQFTCHICGASKMDTLHGLGIHLQEKHQIRGDAVEIPEEGTLIREKATQAVLATWQEVTPKRKINRSFVADQ
jgi:hypothetical protein